nr:tail fiber domain-containing protein [Pantoea cypripedii]
MPAGTITLTNNSATVSGSGTAFATELKANDFLVAVVGGVTYTLGVKSVESATSLTLITAYGGPAASGLAWTALPNQALVGITAQVAADVAKAIRGLNLDKANWQQIYTGTGNVTVTLPDGTTYTGPAWNGITTSLAGKAAKGANNDITSLTGLTTALSVAQGGTGTTTASNAWKALLDGRTVATARGDLGLASNGVPTFGSLELSAGTPFIDFHYNNTAADYDYRLINLSSGTLQGSGTFDSVKGFASRAGNNGATDYNVPWNLYWNYDTPAPNLLAAFVGTTKVGNLAFSTSSDIELKKDKIYLDGSNALNEVMRWKPASFKYKARGILEESDIQYGFIANDLIDISPEVVRGKGLPEGYDLEKNPNAIGAYYLDQMAIIVKLTQAVQAQQQLITSQGEAVASLQKHIAALEGTGS